MVVTAILSDWSTHNDYKLPCATMRDYGLAQIAPTNCVHPSFHPLWLESACPSLRQGTSRVGFCLGKFFDPANLT